MIDDRDGIMKKLALSHLMYMNPVGWFELPATDLDRAQKFYETVFGFQMKRQDNAGYEMVWFPMVSGGKGAAGALMKGMGYVPTLAGPILYFTAPDLDAIVSRVASAGGKIHVPKKDIGEYGWIVICEDTEGNRIGLHRRK
jgi:predicted enzyme related to lactoylglutathione lyase